MYLAARRVTFMRIYLLILTVNVRRAMDPYKWVRYHRMYAMSRLIYLLDLSQEFDIFVIDFLLQMSSVVPIQIMIQLM